MDRYISLSGMIIYPDPRLLFPRTLFLQIPLERGPGTFDGELLHQGLKTRVVAHGREVGVSLEPLFVAVALPKSLLEAVEGFFCFSEEGVGAGDVVKDHRFFGLHGHSAVSPFKGAVRVTKAAKSAAA
jgi:hypothetical protein